MTESRKLAAKGDLERAEELEPRALALDPDGPLNHVMKGNILRTHERAGEGVAEHERAVALDLSNVGAAAGRLRNARGLDARQCLSLQSVKSFPRVGMTGFARTPIRLRRPTEARFAPF
jgi:hypothetical protein